MATSPEHSGSPSPEHGGGPATGWLLGRDFRLMLLATFGAFANYAVLLPIVPAWAAHGGAGPTGAGATNGVFMLCTVLTQLLVPALATRIGYRATLALGTATMGLPTFAYAMTDALPTLVGVSALRGLGFGLLTVSGSALIAELAPARQRGRAAGLYGLAGGLPNVLLLPTGIVAATHWSYPGVFLLSAALPVLSLAAIAAMRRTSGAPDRTPVGRPPFAAFATPWTVMFAVAVASSGITTFVPLAVPAASAVALAGFGVANMAGRWLAGVATDRGLGRLVPVPATLMVAAGLGVLAVAASRGNPAVLAAVAGLVFGLGFGMAQNQTLVALFDRAGTGRHGVASAAWNIAYDAGTGIGAIGLGALAGQAGYPWAFVTVAVLVAGCLPVAWRTGRSSWRTATD
ncbi:MAG: MFS transporter [Actinocatenispora sp.]